ncbi:MAG: hypothetical protein IJ736_14675 [Firmicutes bacterium]|nr:hypothetical protein [Bacillota bacterium]
MNKILSNKEFDEAFNKALSIEELKNLEEYSLKAVEALKSMEFSNDMEILKTTKELDRVIRDNYPGYFSECYHDFVIKFPTYIHEVRYSEDKNILSSNIIIDLLDEFKDRIYVFDSPAEYEYDMYLRTYNIVKFPRILFCGIDLDENIDIKEKTEKILQEHNYKYKTDKDIRYVRIKNNIVKFN